MSVPQEAATAVEQGLFKGIAVVIDDKVDAEAAIKEIVDAIKAGGGHVVALTQLPDDDADLENFAGAAFFILDWNLLDTPHGTHIPAALSAEQLARKVAFLTKLRQHRHAPVFIFTSENPEEVKEALRAHPEIYEDDSSHILVQQKTAVGSEVYRVLNDWAGELPSVGALKSWERANGRAANEVFKDLHDRDPFWPVFLWKMFEDDSLLPADEMGRLITRLVASRMHPPEIDLGPFLPQLEAKFEANPDRYRNALMRVLEGERFLRKERLDAKTFWTGDVFTETDKEGKVTYFINLLPECDCIERKGRTPGKLHLLRGREVPDVLESVDPKFGRVLEQDNEEIVVAMFEGKHVRFAFNADLRVEPWGTWKTKRIGRLLPPFLTRLQQRYAAYSHRPGLPRVPSALVTALPATPSADGVPAAEVTPAESPPARQESEE